MSKGIYITATGTDIGKTYVTGLLVKLLRNSEINAGYYKPALSGAAFVDGEVIPGDCKFVADTAGITNQPHTLASYIYKTAVSPHLAAQIENRPIEPVVIVADFAKAKQHFDYITVEGCGGIVCPLRLDEQTLLQTDIIKLLNLDVLIVASAELGTINSVVLTIDYARNQGIVVKGIILNKYDDSNFLHKDNKQVIERLTQLPVVACVGTNATDLAMDAKILCEYYKEV
ncbi:MAG: dethiobiotin synthetase [Anaerosporomusa subterranea]|nr:dethiobiotin synthetase [Anaerosporomusa subterranea]